MNIIYLFTKINNIYREVYEYYIDIYLFTKINIEYL